MRYLDLYCFFRWHASTRFHDAATQVFSSCLTQSPAACRSNDADLFSLTTIFVPSLQQFTTTMIMNIWCGSNDLAPLSGLANARVARPPVV